MRNVAVLVAVFMSLSAFAGTSANIDKKGVILQGYDVVSYFDKAGPQKGKPEFSVKQGEITYQFASKANLDAFVSAPKKYEPQFGGWCAYAVATSKSKVEVDPKSYLIQDGRLLLFYNGFLADTKKKWQTTKDKDPKAFLKDADTNWPETEKKEP